MAQISAHTVGAAANLVVNNSASGAVCNGPALGNNGVANFLYAANFNSGTIDVFKDNFASVTLAGTFTDASLAAGYAPFNVDNIDGVLHVTYALQDGFDTNVNFIKRLISAVPLDSS